VTITGRKRPCVTSRNVTSVASMLHARTCVLQCLQRRWCNVASLLASRVESRECACGGASRGALCILVFFVKIQRKLFLIKILLSLSLSLSLSSSCSVYLFRTFFCLARRPVASSVSSYFCFSSFPIQLARERVVSRSHRFSVSVKLSFRRLIARTLEIRFSLARI